MRQLLATAFALFFFLSPLQAVGPEIVKGSVVVVPLSGEVTEAQFYFLRRALKHAETAGASAFILDMDTPGGSLKATEQIIQSLLKATMPTFTYVNPNAGSAGALIALGTKNVFMAPVSAIGAAAPVTGEGKDIDETMNAKVVSYYSGYFRSVAEMNGYNPNLVDGFMNLEKEVKIGDTVLNPKGSILTLSAQETIRQIDGKPLLARGIVKSLDQLCEQAGLNASAIVRLEPSGFELIAQWITMLAPLFLLGGIMGAYIEFKTAGFGVAGVLSGLCFLLFFTGHYVAGLTGYEVIAIFCLGFVLIFLELFLFPGVIVLAATGAAMMMGALLFAMVDFYPSHPFTLSYDSLLMPMMNLGIAVLLAMFAIALLARYLHDIPLFNRLVLASQSPTGPSQPLAGGRGTNTKPVTKGDEGVARSTLRPSGKADFEGMLLDVMTGGEFLEAGTPLRVVSNQGDCLIVEALPQKS